MEPSCTIRKSAGVLIRDRKLVVARSRGKNFFIAPGGKPEDLESLEEALVRELMEELTVNVQAENLEHFGHFSAPAAGKTDAVVEMTVFLVKSWDSEPTPGSEVEEIHWIDSLSARDIELGSIFAHEVVPRLKAMDLID